MFQNAFKELDLSEVTRQVYLYLIEHGTSSARTIAENLGIPRPSAYDNLKLLIQKGLVLERDEEHKKFFQVDDLKQLSRLLTEKAEELRRERDALDTLLPSLKTKTDSVEPRIKFYSGVEGVRQVLNDIHWYHDLDTMSLWPVSEMVGLLGKEYFADFNRKRIRQKIFIRAIWPQDKRVSFKENPFLGTGGGHLRELRLAPKGLSWNMGYWIYADKVAFLSSRKETFGFIIRSRDFANMMKTQFESVWKASKPVKAEARFTDAFLATVRAPRTTP